jgi:hypothetical protein
MKMKDDVSRSETCEQDKARSGKKGTMYEDCYMLAKQRTTPLSPLSSLTLDPSSLKAKGLLLLMPVPS